jgi:hypothetical protein
MKVSVIIPTYQASATLEQALASVVGQSYPDKEVWIIDGQSTDATLEIVRQYAAQHSFIRYVSEKDSGIYDAMNKGIALAQGDWLYFLGADDRFFSPNALADALADVPPESLLLYGRVWNQAQQRLVHYEDNTLDTAFFLTDTLCHQAVLMHRRAFALLGTFDLSYRLCADKKLIYDTCQLPEAHPHRVGVTLAYYAGSGSSGAAANMRQILTEAFGVSAYIFEQHPPDARAALVASVWPLALQNLKGVLAYGVDLAALLATARQMHPHLHQRLVAQWQQKSFWAANASASGAYLHIHRYSVSVGLRQLYAVRRQAPLLHHLRHLLYWLKKRLLSGS